MEDYFACLKVWDLKSNRENNMNNKNLGKTWKVQDPEHSNTWIMDLKMHSRISKDNQAFHPNSEGAVK